MIALDLLSIGVGAVLVLIGLYEVYRTLLHPSGRGRVTRGVATAIWTLCRRFGKRGRQVAGPLATLAVIVTWTLFQILGWALIYLPFVPEGFSYSPGLDPSAHPAFIEALYISMVNLSTLGLGDAVPVSAGLRLIAPLQSLFGFALLTAAVSWFMELYPGIGRRRALALHIALLERTGAHREIATMEAGPASALLGSLTAGLTQAQVDLSQNEEVFYFSSGVRHTSLAANIRYCLVLSRQARQSPHRSVQLAARVLEEAVGEYAAFLRDNLRVSGDTTEIVLVDYSRQHGFVD